MESHFRKTVQVPESLRVSANDWSINDVNNQLLIQMFGTTPEGHTVLINIRNVQAYFYIKKDPNVNWGLLLTKFKDYIYKSECETITAKNFYGFNAENEDKFIKIVCKNYKCFTTLRYKFANPIMIGSKRVSLELFESNLDPLLRFFHTYDLQPCGFFEISNYQKLTEKLGNTQIEITTTPNSLNTTKPWERNILQASYDIECFSKDNSFPNPDTKENVITHISTTFKSLNSYFNVIFSLNSDIIDTKFDYPVYHKVFDNEADLLRCWTNLIKQTDPDILYQYNGDQFDGNYIYTRLKRHGIPLTFSKLRNESCTISNSKFSSSAYGTTYYKRLLIPGRIHFDVMIYMSRNFKEDSYSLEYISQKYLGSGKNEMTVIEIFDSYRNNDKDVSKKVAEYCVRDTILPQMLIDHFNIFQAQVSMANVCYVPFNYLIYRGQQIKVFSQICKFTSPKGYLVPTLKSETETESEESFTGATVLEPIKGLYQEPIAVLDFASLYPSIIRAHNLCYSSIVLDKKYLGLQGYSYETFNGVTFVQNVPGVLPEILAKMALCRKSEKALMKQTEGLQKSIHDMNQNAYKISMNSLYGFLAANMLKCKDIASTVTFVGRNMINKTTEYVESTYSGAKTQVVYGDSVTADTPILVKNHDTVFIKRIDSLYKGNEIEYPHFKPNDNGLTDKTYTTSYYQVWTDIGWSDIKKVIRHKTNKRIFKVSTNCSSVKVTEDHSLLSPDLTLLKPMNCQIDTQLLTCSHNEIGKYQLSKELCEYYAYLTNSIDVWSDSVSYTFPCIAYRDEFMELHKKLFPEIQFTFHDKCVYVSPIDNPKALPEPWVEHWCKYRDSRLQISNMGIPDELLNAETQCMKWFLEKYNAIQPYFDQILPKFERVHLDSNDTQKARLRYIQLRCQEIQPDNKVTSITLMPKIQKEYVYDLETSCGRFQAGIGNIIVKNTDSVFINFKKDYQTTKKLGYEAAEGASKLFKAPIKLEFEKIYQPFLLFSKKRYAGMYHNIENDKIHLDSKGIVIKRRDNCKLLRQIYSDLLDLVMSKDFTKPKAIELINDFVDRLQSNHYDLDSLTITKTIKDTYKNTNLPHLVVADLMRQRGLNVQINQRIPYVFIKKPGLKSTDNQGKRAEHTEHVRDFNLQIDYDYYIQKQFFNPLAQILELFCTQSEINKAFKIYDKETFIESLTNHPSPVIGTYKNVSGKLESTLKIVQKGRPKKNIKLLTVKELLEILKLLNIKPNSTKKPELVKLLEYTLKERKLIL